MVKSETLRDAEILVRNPSPRLFVKKFRDSKKVKTNHAKTRLRDLSKMLPRFRDPVNIFRDPRFSRYHSPPLICIDIYPCVTAYVTRMYQPGLCGMVSRKMNSLEFSHRHHFRIRASFRILNSLEFSIVSKHEAGRIWLRNTSPHEYNLLFVIKCRGESNVCGQHLQQKSF